MDVLIDNWLIALLALLAAIAVGWYIFHASRRTRITGARRDVLDEGAAPAARNQALIDAPQATASDIPLPPLTPAGMAGVGEVVEAAVEQEHIRAAPSLSGDDLSRIKGVGPKIVTLLGELGVTSWAQIAGWSDADIDRIDARMGRFQGRILRDSWVEQAKLLSAGDESGFAARFGNLN